MKFLGKHEELALKARYGIEIQEDAYRMLQDVAKARACLLKGNELDTNKAAAILLEEFRNGKIGQITLEFPPTEG